MVPRICIFIASACMHAKHSGRLTECILVGETEVKSYFQSPIRIRIADLLARFRLARCVSNNIHEKMIKNRMFRRHLRTKLRHLSIVFRLLNSHTIFSSKCRKKDEKLGKKMKIYTANARRDVEFPTRFLSLLLLC